jgi:serine/threonine-protein kinase
LRPEEGDPIAELEKIGTFDPAASLPTLGAEPSPQLATTQPATPPPAPAPQTAAAPAPPPASAAPATPAFVPEDPVVKPAQPAAAPPPVVAAAPQAPPPLDRAAELRASIASFDGGNCFFAMPLEVSDNAATIEAFASSVPPVQTLDETFRRENGFEAQIGLRQVAPPQCAAVDFLRAADTSLDQAPTVQVDSVMLRNGQTLLGAVTDPAGRSLAVLLVADDGTVHDISDTLRGSAGRMTFEVKLTGSSQGAVKPLLLMVLATDKPLVTLDARPLPAAADLFPILSQEAKLGRQQIGAALKYLKLEG